MTIIACTHHATHTRINSNRRITYQLCAACVQQYDLGLEINCGHEGAQHSLFHGERWWLVCDGCRDKRMEAWLRDGIAREYPAFAGLLLNGELQTNGGVSGAEI